MSRIPQWIRLSLDTNSDYRHVHAEIAGRALHTVCESAKCPNRGECWNEGTATMMLLGDICTRACRFCAVKSGRPEPADTEEPDRVASAARSMKLKYVVLTSVNRDDMPDGGAGIFAETISAIKRELPEASVEVLTPDFEGVEADIASVLRARPEVFSHNLETVRRLQPIVRPMASYGRSLAVLKYASEWRPEITVKSAIMVGLGETEDELYEAMDDLLDAGCQILAMGQYLRPSRKHIEVSRYADPEEFERMAARAREKGFRAVASGPMVRSSYRARELYESAVASVSTVG
ncbi:MAG: lipoyl synthase [Verrucomicrobia bacterium]|nr:lipoyl synthase [Verrucomicrobiota bacterium]